MLAFKKIACLSLCFAPSLLFAVDYNVSGALANTILGPNGFAFTISAATPFNLSDGDTLTVDNANLGAGINLNTGQYLIGLGGNNTVTVNSAKSITATFNPGNSGYVFQPTGNNFSTIILQTGATIQTTQTNSALYNPTSSIQQIMVQNFGALSTAISANLVNSPNNVLAICGTLPPTALGPLNSGGSVGNSSLYIGGYIDNNGSEQLKPSTFTYSNPNVLNPFNFVRVMAGSTFNLQGDIPVATALAYNEWVVDITATLNLQVSTATPNESLTVNKFRNYGTTSMVAGANAKLITANNFLNAGVLQLTGQNTKINGFGVNTMIKNVSTGTILIGSNNSALIQNFNLFINSGSVTSAGTLLNITTINNDAGGVFTFDNGSIYDTITTINNAAHAIMNFNNATSNNNAGLTLSNEGQVNFESGDFGALNITNNGTITLSGGTIGRTLALSTSIIDNNLEGMINGTAGQIGTAGQNYVPLIRNYGQINLNGVPVVATTLNNYGSFIHQNANLTITTFTNPLNSSLNVSGAAAVSLGASFNNYGEIILNNVGNFGSVINNYGSVSVGGTTVMPAMNNFEKFTINSGAIYNAGATTFSNNANLQVLGATITMNTLSNIAGAITTFSAMIPGANTFTGNINNSGVVIMSGTFNHAGTYTGNNGSTLIVDNITNYLGSNPLTQQGIFQSNIVDDNNFGKLIINQNISLSNCDIVININQSLTNQHQFTILQTTGGHTITAAPNAFQNINNFLYSLIVTPSSTAINVDYSRTDLTTLSLSDNSKQLATKLEAVYATHQDNDVDQFMSSLLNFAKNTSDVESVLQQLAPIPIAPPQCSYVQRLVDNQISERMLSTVVAYNSGEYANSFGTWLRWLSSKNKQKPIANNVGYKFSTQGFVIGIEAETDIGSYLGLALALTKSYSKQLDYKSTTKNTTWQLAAYSQNYWTKKFFSNFLFGVANNNINQIKIVNFDAYNRNTFANYDWQNFFAKAEAGYVLNPSDSYRFIPKVSVKGLYLKGYSYQEYGNGNLNLTNTSSAVYALDVGLGANFIADLLLFDNIFQPQINFSVSVNLLQTPYVIRSSFVNSQPFVNTTLVPKIGSQFGVGFKYIINQNMEFDFAYNIDYYQSFLGRTWQLQAKYNF